LHRHFVDFYGAFELGIRHLSVKDKEKKRTEYQKGDDICNQYVVALDNVQVSDSRNSKKE
jgi:hypothetical protein